MDVPTFSRENEYMNIISQIRRREVIRAKLAAGPCTVESPPLREVVLNVEHVGRVRFTCSQLTDLSHHRPHWICRRAEIVD
jgi:hypothetical protein